MNVPKFRWRDTSQWERWAPRSIGGTTYTFDHLLAFDMTVERPARGDLPSLLVHVRVVFDCHVVTESVGKGLPAGPPWDSAVWIDSGGRERRFNQSRYLRSLGLPLLIRGLTNGQSRCYVASAHNYMVCERIDVQGRSEYYQVYFDLYRPTNESRLVMYVQSAYVKDHPLAASRKHAKPFATLCAEKIGAVPRKGLANKKAP